MYRHVAGSGQKNILGKLSWRNQRMEHHGAAGRVTRPSVKPSEIEPPEPAEGFALTYARYAATMCVRGLKPLPPKKLLDPKRKEKSRARRKQGGAGK